MWDEADAFREKHARVRSALLRELIVMGWVVVETDDGTFGARRWRPGDRDEVMWWDGEPELRGATPEILVATVRVHYEAAKAEAAKDAPWHCAACGHQHKGAWLAHICIGCPCNAKPPEPKKEVRA